MRRDRSRLAAILPGLWLAVFFAFPFLLIARLSLSDTALAMPPYAPHLDWSAGLAGIPGCPDRRSDPAVSGPRACAARPIWR